MIVDDLSKRSFEGVMVVRWLGTPRNTAAFSIVKGMGWLSGLGPVKGP